MSAIVLATTYFAAAWLGRGVRKDVLVAHIEHMHQRFCRGMAGWTKFVVLNEMRSPG